MMTTGYWGRKNQNPNIRWFFYANFKLVKIEKLAVFQGLR